MAAKFVDALKGYEYFLENRGNISIDEINTFLRSKGRNEISQRTFGHFKKLVRYGIMSYVPINQFDVDITLGRLQMATDRRRYSREIINIDVWVSMDGNEWIKAEVINKSQVGLGLYTENEFRFRTKRIIWVRIDNYNDIPSILVWKLPYKNGHRFGVRSFEFINNYQFDRKSILLDRLTHQLVVRKTSGDKISWQELLRIISKIDELIGASSDLLDSIAKLIDIELKLSRPVLSSVKFSSPGEFVINIALALAFLILGILKTIQLWKPTIRQFKEVTRGIKLKNDILEVQKARKIVKLRKEAVDPNIKKQLLDNLSPSIKQALNIDILPSNIFENSVEDGILNSRLIPATLDLAFGDDPDIEIQIIKISSKKSPPK